jgi:predicted XRE-type DNA-binding protein
MEGAPEIWKPVPGFEGLYEVSDLGRARSLRTGKVLKPALRGHYWGYTFKVAGKCTWKRTHGLVASAFMPPRKPKEVVRHFDGDRGNNTLSNLVYGSQKDNAEDSARHGTRLRGTQKVEAKLTEAQVLDIREDRRVQREIAAAYGVHQSLVSRIKQGKLWAHV